MNKYIKLKKRYPASRDWSIAEIKAIAAKPPEKRTLWTFWYKNGKINFINELRAQRMIERGEYYYGPVGSMKRGKDRRRIDLENALHEMWCRKPHVLKGGIFNKKGDIICNKCGSDDLKLIYHSDGWHCVDYKYECKNCGNGIYQLIRGGGNQYVFL